MRDGGSSRQRAGVPDRDRRDYPRYRFPEFPSRFIGRQEEIAATKSLLERVDVRLLTLTGPPGIGKTRLAVEISQESTADFEHGLAFVDLASIAEPTLVPHAIAKALGVVDARGRDPSRRLIEYLENKRLLLILDNIEQVIDAAPQVSGLLAACSGVKVLATGREPFHLSWEQEMAVAPLAIPNLNRLSAPDMLPSYAAIALFLDRARMIRPNFSLTADNAQAVAEICVRLDGLPLAIEMAAARIRSLTPAEVVRRLSDRLEILASGARDAPERHRTLRSAIAWSYDLLPPVEQALFRRLAVFSGGFGADAVLAVCDGSGAGDVDQGLSALVDKNLLRHEPQRDGRSRYSLLESLREFGLKELASKGEIQSARERHAMYFVALAQQAEPYRHSAEQSDWMGILNAEHANLRAALGWCYDNKRIMLGLQSAVALLWFWEQGGHWEIGRRWLERFLDSSGAVPSTLRAKGRSALGRILYFEGKLDRAYISLKESLREFQALEDVPSVIRVLYFLTDVLQWREEYTEGETAAQEGLALARSRDDAVGISEGLARLGNLASNRGEYEAAGAFLREALAVGHAVDYGRRRGLIRYSLGRVEFAQGHADEAAARFEEALAIFHKIDSKWDAARAVVRLGDVAALRGDFDASSRLYEEGLSQLQDLGDARWSARVFRGLAILAMKRGDFKRAQSLIKEGLRRSFESGAKLEAADCLDTAMVLTALEGRAEFAARLAGAVEHLRETIRAPRIPVEQLQYVPVLAAARGRIGPRAFEAAQAAGQALTLDQAVGLVMSWDVRAAEPGVVSPRAVSPLSRRESEVAGLIARGFSNRQIAAALFITEHTVESHVEHILNKLGFDARTQIAAWVASENRLGSV